MKNITLIAILVIFVSQMTYGQRGPSSPTDRDKRPGIGGKFSENAVDKKTREALRGAGGSSGGEEARKKLEENGLGHDEGRPDSGRPDLDDGEENPREGGGKASRKKHHHHPKLREIIKKELELTEAQMEKLRKIHNAWHERVKDITGGKKFSDLSKDQKKKLAEAWNKFRSARAKILSEEQLAKLKEILEKHREIGEDEREKAIREKREKGEGGREKGKGGDIGEGGRKKGRGGPDKGRPEKGEGGREKGEGGREKGRPGDGKTLENVVGRELAEEIEEIYNRFAPRFRAILSNDKLSAGKKKRALEELEADRDALLRKQLSREQYEKFMRWIRAGGKVLKR